MDQQSQAVSTDPSSPCTTIAPQGWESSGVGRLLQRVFGGLRMSWPVVIIYAVVCGIYCGVVAQIPALHGTSLSDIAVTWEAWVILALIVSANCSKPLESALKCFVFFAISQPLVYLVELPTLGSYPWYYLSIWTPAIIASAAAGFLAFFMRQQNAFGLVVTICAGGCITMVGGWYLGNMITQSAFPAHLLTVIFDIIAGVFVVMLFQHRRAMRIVGTIVVILGLVATLGINITNNNRFEVSYLLDPSTTWEVESASGHLAECEVELDNGLPLLAITCTSKEGCVAHLVNDRGETLTVRAYFDDDAGIWTVEDITGRDDEQ